MKAKALLVAGLVLGAATSAFAQGTVYSVNAVGFVNKTLLPGFSLISNPLNAPTNTLNALLPAGSVPNGTAIYKFDGTSFSSSFFFGTWVPNFTVVPGEGFFIRNPVGTNITITFVGNVQQGTLTTSLPAGFWIASSQVPQSGEVETVLGLPVANGNSVYRFNPTNQQYSSSFYFAGWGGNEPRVDVGEAFFVNRATPVSWTRVFSVSQ